MKKSSLIIFGLVLILGVGLYFLSPLSRSNNTESEIIETEVETEPLEPVPSETSNSEAKSQTQPIKVSSEETSAAPASSVQKQFAQNLRALGQCLETQNSVPGDELEPTLRTVVDSVRGEWGESVISTEDWLQIDMETPDGEKRRIRVEMDFDNETQVQRKLKFVTLDPNGETRPIAVPEEQAVEPSESLIASLEAGNKILNKEKFERIYFQNGEEIVARQANGFLVELEVNKGNKSFKCNALNQEKSTCQCL